MLGVLTIEKAREAAREREVDLVEISPNAVPPVCKLMDFGKFLYQQSKKAQDARRHQTKIHVKEVKFRPKTDEHDYNFKKNHVLRFLKQGDKVKTTIMFRGREIVHVDYGMRILKRLLEEIRSDCIVEVEPKQEGNNLSMILSPKQQQQPKPQATEGGPARG
jgi:translation initiation factor IF-3